MYTPPKMLMTNPDAVTAFIKQYNFGVMISASLNATHLPFVFEAKQGEKGVLYGHVSRANKHWQEIDQQRVVVIFSGAHAYISPTWYDATPAVPTWNYAAVHCYGVVNILSDAENQTVLDSLVAQHEPRLLHNKQLIPDEYQLRLRQAIVAFKIVLDDIQAKEKLGQHKSIADQQGVFAALSQSKNLDAQQLAAYMAARNIGTGQE